MEDVPWWGAGMVRRRVAVATGDVVLLRSILEAYEGLAMLTGSASDGRGGPSRVVTLTAPGSRADELDALLFDLSVELAIRPVPDDGVVP